MWSVLLLLAVMSAIASVRQRGRWPDRFKRTNQIKGGFATRPLSEYRADTNLRDIIGKQSENTSMESEDRKQVRAKEDVDRRWMKKWKLLERHIVHSRSNIIAEEAESAFSMKEMNDKELLQEMAMHKVDIVRAEQEAWKQLVTDYVDSQYHQNGTFSTTKQMLIVNSSSQNATDEYQTHHSPEGITHAICIITIGFVLCLMATGLVIAKKKHAFCRG